MPVYKPLSSTPRIQKAFVPIMVMIALGVVADFVDLVLSLLEANGIDLSSTVDFGPLIIFAFGATLKFAGALWFLIVAICDTADHDHTYNHPVIMGFVACCVPPLTVFLPFVFLQMIVNNTQDIIKRDLIKEKVLLWTWCACYVGASGFNIYGDLESMVTLDGSTAFSQAMDNALWVMGGIVSIMTIHVFSAMITETRKTVIRLSAQHLHQNPNPQGQPNLSQWDPDDPYRPRF